jgi:hypothetical protein
MFMPQQFSRSLAVSPRLVLTEVLSFELFCAQLENLLRFWCLMV